MSEILQQTAELLEHGIPCALCTVVRTAGSVPRHAGAKMLIGADGALLAGTVGGGAMESRVQDEAHRAIADGQTRLITYQLTDPETGDAGVCGGQVDIFIEPLLAAPSLIIIGAGHVGRAVVHLAKWCGFQASVIDDRPELCTPSACPGAVHYYCAPVAQALAQVNLNPSTYVAMVTRGVQVDVEALPILLKSPVTYIGVIGSKRRWMTAVQQLRDQGITDAELVRIHAPIGLEIGAETPEEIAISILAQIIGLRHGIKA